MKNIASIDRKTSYVIPTRSLAKLFGHCLADYGLDGEAKMKFKIEARENQGIFILDLKGRLILGDADSTLRQELTTALESGQRNVLLNMREVSALDSAALGTLVHFAQRFREAKGKLALLELAGSETKLPELLKLDSVFETYRDEVSAINSFFPDRVVPRYDILDFIARQELSPELS